MEREKFSSRLGFILISAGCAIGFGNVWRFPYITGKYGGAAFVHCYTCFSWLSWDFRLWLWNFPLDVPARKAAALSFDDSGAQRDKMASL